MKIVLDKNAPAYKAVILAYQEKRNFHRNGIGYRVESIKVRDDYSLLVELK